MNQGIYEYFVSLYEDRGSRWKVIIFFFPLYLASIAYGFFGLLRALCYRAGIFKTRVLPAFVISVGNITAGGQGKTPVVIWLAEKIRGFGIPVAVISRGYGFDVPRGCLVVAGKDGVLLASGEGPDEAIMTARHLPGVPVVVGPDRFRAGTLACERFGARVIIMDDGYQHLRVNRDVNILVMDSKNPFGNGFILPAGPLREPICQTARADILWLTGDGGEMDVDAISRVKRHMKRKIGDGSISPIVTRSVVVTTGVITRTGETLPLGELKNKRAAVFCGIARPDRFFATIKRLGIRIVSTTSFRDHYNYTERDFTALVKSAKDVGADVFITTEKDLARIPERASLPLPVWGVKISLATEGDGAVLKLVRAGFSGEKKR